jgi:uncharacterized protein YacL (UPF0231 family)
MRFLNEAIRKEYHLLTVERQKALQDTDERLQPKGLELYILMIEGDEISLRIEHIAPVPKDDRPDSYQS